MKQKVIQLLFELRGRITYLGRSCDKICFEPKMYFIILLKGAFCGYSLFSNLENVLNHI